MAHVHTAIVTPQTWGQADEWTYERSVARFTGSRVRANTTRYHVHECMDVRLSLDKVVHT